MKFIKPALFILTAFLLSQVPAFAGGWTDNYKLALDKASKENKKVLLDFTGSDWCSACKQLKKAIFDKPEFQKFADKNLVLVEVDFPVGKTLSHQVKMQNDALADHYDAGNALPTLILLDPQGKVIKKQEGYDPAVSPKDFINWINSAS
jgi:thioredoxin-related protein